MLLGDHDQVELGGAGVKTLCTEPESLAGDGCLFHVLQHEHDVEERVSAGLATKPETFHHFFELHILVFKGQECLLLDFGQQIDESVIAANRVSQGQGVDEHADDMLQVRVTASAGRCADDDILLAA